MGLCITQAKQTPERPTMLADPGNVQGLAAVHGQLGADFTQLVGHCGYHDGKKNCPSGSGSAPVCSSCGAVHARDINAVKMLLAAGLVESLSRRGTIHKAAPMVAAGCEAPPTGSLSRHAERRRNARPSQGREEVNSASVASQASADLPLRYHCQMNQQCQEPHQAEPA